MTDETQLTHAHSKRHKIDENTSAISGGSVMALLERPCQRPFSLRPLREPEF